MDELIALAVSVFSGVMAGVIVSLVTLWLAARQRAGEEGRRKRREGKQFWPGLDVSCIGTVLPPGQRWTPPTPIT